MSSSISCGVNPARAAIAGSTLNSVAGPLMVFSMPSSTSTTPGSFLIASPTFGAHSLQQRRILREQLDGNRLGRAGQVADHVLQQLHEFHVERRLALR